MTLTATSRITDPLAVFVINRTTDDDVLAIVRAYLETGEREAVLEIAAQWPQDV